MKKIVFSMLMISVAGLARGQFISNTGIEITNNSIISTNGDWQNLGQITNNGLIQTTDSWTNNGTLISGAGAGFVLDFSLDKAFMPGASSLGFLIKKGAGNAILSGIFSIEDSLVLENGYLTYQSDLDLLSINENGLVAVSNNAFVENRLLRKGNGNLFFPIGKDGYYLPITLIQVEGTLPEITASLIESPSYNAGAGVDAWIDFPYAWQLSKGNVTDTSSYIEVEYPNILPTVGNAIIVRALATQNLYEGMGARSQSTNNGVVKVRSYSRGLHGTFSVAQGFAGNRQTDSLALVALFNATDGPNWTKKSNWMTGALPTWQGVTETGGLITSLQLNEANLQGSVPDQINDILALQSINLSVNEITSLPSFQSLTALTSLNVSENRLEFDDIIPNLGIDGFNFAEQKAFGENTTIIGDVGEDINLQVSTPGDGNAYQWFKATNPIGNANESSLEITDLDYEKMGIYSVEVSNPLVSAVSPNFVLKSANQTLLAQANISGTTADLNANAVSEGDVYLFRITDSGKYDTIASVGIESGGIYELENIILDDYLIMAVPNEASFPELIPSYFKGTIDWEDADVFQHRTDSSGVDVVLQGTPAPLQGGSIVSGYFEEELPEGRILARARIAGSGTTLRRDSGQGRGLRAMADQVVAFVKTDENGEFVFNNIEEGSYQIKFEYPGVPMDLSSELNFDLDNSTKLLLSANVIDGQISVTTISVLGLGSAKDKLFLVYPNPTDNNINLMLDTQIQEEVQFQIIDMAGKNVRSFDKQVNNSPINISLGGLAPGLYLIQAFGKSGSLLGQGRVSLK